MYNWTLTLSASVPHFESVGGVTKLCKIRPTNVPRMTCLCDRIHVYTYVCECICTHSLSHTHILQYYMCVRM